MFTRLLRMTALAIAAISFSGCSLLIENSGIVLRDLDTRQIVHDRLGQPDNVSVVDLVDPRSEKIRQFEVEHYHVHAKFNTAMPVGASSGLIILMEPIMTCSALYNAAKEVAVGHSLEFVYDEQGNTIGYKYPQSFHGSGRSSSSQSNVLNWKRADESSKP